MCYARRQRSSWARIKLSNEWYLKSLRTLNLLSSYDLLFYFLLSSILFQNFRVPFRTYYMLVLSSLLFNFQWPFRSALSWASLTIISLLKPFVNRFFKKVLSFFNFFLDPSTAFRQLCHYTTFCTVCQGVLENFFLIFQKNRLRFPST